MPKTLGRLTKLEELDLFGTSVKSLPDELFALPALTHLRLGGTRDLVLRPGTLGALPLVELDLWRHAETDIPADVFSIASLTTLRLGNTALTAVPDAIGELPNLASLSLECAAIRALPESFSRLGKLRSLDLTSCVDLDLEPAFRVIATLALTDLKVDGAPDRSFSSIPSGIGAIRTLKRLSIRGSWLRSIPADIFTLTSLESLDLSQNRLSALPMEIVDLRKLKELSLEFNRANPNEPDSTDMSLDALFAAAPQLSKLKQLNVARMNLLDPPGDFTAFKALKKLVIGGECPALRDELVARLPGVQVS